MRILARFTLLATLMPALAGAAWNYPEAPKSAQTDDYHGTKVDDPFRWLEDVDSAGTKKWVGAENQVTFDFLKNLPKRDSIRERLKELLNYPRYSLPTKEGGRYFYTHNRVCKTSRRFL